MRPSSKVKTRRGGSLPSSFSTVSACVYAAVSSSAISYGYDIWTFTMEQPYSCAVTPLGMTSLQSPKNQLELQE